MGQEGVAPAALPLAAHHDHVLTGVAARAGLPTRAVRAAVVVAHVAGVDEAVVRTAAAGLDAAAEGAGGAVGAAFGIVVAEALRVVVAASRGGPRTSRRSGRRSRPGRTTDRTVPISQAASSAGVVASQPQAPPPRSGRRCRCSHPRSGSHPRRDRAADRRPGRCGSAGPRSSGPRRDRCRDWCRRTGPCPGSRSSSCSRCGPGRSPPCCRTGCADRRRRCGSSRRRSPPRSGSPRRRRCRSHSPRPPGSRPRWRCRCHRR